ncbi:hypothetical protein PCANB_000624 [Pneumocystis canis]|nr:hypothetical protein PCANB_000624 [Pneumocystis canis]
MEDKNLENIINAFDDSIVSDDLNESEKLNSDSNLMIWKQKNKIFDKIFDGFDPDKTGKIQPIDAEPIFDHINRKQAEEFISENQNLQVDRNDLLTFIESLTGRTIASITQEQFISSQENSINTDFLSSRPRSAPLNTMILQCQKPRRSNIKDYVDSSNSGKKKTLRDNTFEIESLNLSPISHSTPTKKQFNDTSYEHLKTPTSRNSSSRISEESFIKFDFIQSKVNEDPGKVILEGFGSSPFSILCRDVSDTSLLEKSPQTLQKDENILFLTDLLKKYKDTERQNNALITRHEQHIDELESKLEILSSELKDKKKELFETNSREKNLFGQVIVLEKELEKLQRDIRSWEDKYLGMKMNCDEYINEIEHIKKILKEKENELAKSGKIVKDLKEDKDSVKQYQELELKNQELEEYKFENIRLNELIERLNFDLEEIKKEKLKENLLDDITMNTKKNHLNLENELLPKLQDNETDADRKSELNTQQSFTKVSIKTLDKGIQVNTFQKTNIISEDKDNSSLSLNMNDSLKTFCFPNIENLGNFENIHKEYNAFFQEMNSQDHLIEKLFQYKFKTPEKVDKNFKDNLKFHTLFLFLNSAFFKKSLNWVMLILYICITFFISIWIVHQEWFLWVGKRPKGITYAEFKAWKRANSLNFRLYENRIIGSRRTWLEGNWRWINCLGWWIDNLFRDLDTQWPS